MKELNIRQANEDRERLEVRNALKGIVNILEMVKERLLELEGICKKEGK